MMYQFAPDSDQPKPDLYRELAAAARALTADERDATANMANVAALIWQFVPRINWAGFYRVIDGGLVLGPFIGKPACIRISFGQGVCGSAVATGETQLVRDVLAFPGHIRSEEHTSELQSQ